MSRKTARKKTASKRTASKRTASKKTASKKSASKKTTGGRAAKPASKKAARVRAATAPSERRPDFDLVDATLERLREHDRTAGASDLAIGEHLLDTYYGGDEEAARSKSPRKPMSYALLAERAEAETSWDESDLRRVITMAATYRSLASQIRASIAPSYLLELGKIRDLGTRRGLAAKIASGELAGEDLKDAITRANASERGGGRPAAPALVSLARRLSRTLEQARAAGALAASARRELDDEARASTASALRALRDQLDALLRALD
ncbi:MAG: hypothetical protein IT378_19895 [Sandaracinaceae bacterium]|nr:hypothetical protein [Sandaracinaceae bacterium]